MTLIWEHGHAYQPRRLIDAFTSKSREVENGVSITLDGTAKRAANWFELMLTPGGVYDILIAALDTRSFDIEPLTLLHLKKLNPKAYEELKEYVRQGKTSIILCPFSHPILPLLVEKSLLDTEVNLHWTLQVILSLFGLPKDKRVFLWLAECAYSQEVARTVLAVIRGILPEAQIFLLLDEFQGHNVEPSQPYKVTLAQGDVYALFRSRWLSDAYAFSSDAEWVIHSIRSDIARRNPRLLGIMIDAETYGGAYGPEKMVFFRKIREGVDGKVDAEGGSIPVTFGPVNRGAVVTDDMPKVRLLDRSSWSDYSKNQLLNPKSTDTTGIIAQGVSSLCRWTGLISKFGEKPEETYFMVFKWTEPNSHRRYLRVLSSLWKVAFNTLRDETTRLVRNAVLEMLSQIGALRPPEHLLFDYWQVVLDSDGWENFAKAIGIGDDAEKCTAARLLLEAYRMANQESIMSDPTYWENLDTEVTWSSLALIAASIIFVAKASQTLGRNEWLRKSADIFSTLFLDFESHFSALWREYDHPMGQLYELLAERSKRNGFDLDGALEKAPLTTESALAIARSAYRMAFEQTSETVYEPDMNPFLILWKMHETRGLKEEAASFLESSIIFEWQKSVRSAVSDKSIPVRVGLQHARHFPAKETFGFHEANVETRTEIIGGEAHAY